VDVVETFTSIQGESTWAGHTCFFVRLSGCNLSCAYCDTRYAMARGRSMTISDIVRAADESRASIIELTGGEPLLQPELPSLAAALRDETGRPVLVETNGSRDISVIPDDVIAIMDVKCPGSGEHESTDLQNLGRLRQIDEVKFVIGGRADYEWASAFVGRYGLASLCHAVLFSPAFGKLHVKTLGGWILKDRLPVRLQIQLHRMLDMR
jgi:7-carboxy-7-deazaguanine synthase